MTQCSKLSLSGWLQQLDQNSSREIESAGVVCSLHWRSLDGADTDVTKILNARRANPRSSNFQMEGESRLRNAAFQIEGRWVVRLEWGRHRSGRSAA
jgi:hypothetical protein